MKKHHFLQVIKSVEATSVHKIYSIEAGFIAITSPGLGRDVIHDYDDFENVKHILYIHQIKYLHGTENESQSPEA